MLPSSVVIFVGIPEFPLRGYLVLKELRLGHVGCQLLVVSWLPEKTTSTELMGTPPNNGAPETGFLQEQFLQSYHPFFTCDNFKKCFFMIGRVTISCLVTPVTLFFGLRTHHIACRANPVFLPAFLGRFCPL